MSHRRLLPSVLFSLAAVAAVWGVTSDEEFAGPFPSWANVKTMYGARGDGTTDDTAALQNALNDVGSAGKSDVLYLPAGTYRITATLSHKAKKYVTVVGEHPERTKIVWAGPAGGTMYWANGVTYSRWGRITWDGAGVAGIGVAHKWDKANWLAFRRWRFSTQTKSSKTSSEAW